MKGINFIKSIFTFNFETKYEHYVTWKRHFSYRENQISMRREWNRILGNMKTFKALHDIEGDCIGLPLWLTHKLHPSNEPTVTQLDDIASHACRWRMQLEAKIDANMETVCINQTFYLV